ncbi:MAG: RHS repeat-associated core domain-containing protein [Candidatus Binatus sp.]|uniref:RHS repeat-associated core domain-containing protein n=1 Tax=Candidatus Binatus sp. TaxID=2811406 RepID=UPI003C720C04
MAASFTYDALGRRASKSIAGTTTNVVYDVLNPVQELQAGAPSANLFTGRRLDEYFTRTDSSDNVSTLLTDALGSTIGLVGSGQSIATSYTYQPFGATTVGGAANGSSYQFTGREDDGTGLYFYRARYYSATFQRFISQDPIGFAGGSPNIYSYAANAPTIFNDPFGLYWYQGVEYTDGTSTPIGELGLQPDLPVPNVTIGLSTPLGGFQTTLPFNSGGPITTVPRGAVYTVPLPWPPDSVISVFPQGQPGGTASIQCQARSPFGGIGSGIDANLNGTGNSILGPQVNIPIPPLLSNVAIGFKW